MNNLPAIRQYSDLILVKVAANLRSETSGNYLGYLWWIFEPALRMLVYYLVFGFLLRRGTDDYVLFLLTGLIPCIWFTRSVAGSMISIIQGKGLMMQVHLPKIILPTIRICQDAVKETVVIILLFIFLLLYGVSPSLPWFALPVMFVTEFLLIAASAYIISAVIPFFPDLRIIVPVGLQMIMFCSGTFYSIDMIPAQYHRLFLMNPVASLLHNYRNILLYNQWPDWNSLLFITAGSLVAIYVMWLVFRRLDHFYPRITL
ncbi:MAG: ABC transporter permease [Desulfosarcina sp.]|nr:ABC transporter permease [Desulfobacterales bacterium]